MARGLLAGLLPAWLAPPGVRGERAAARFLRRQGYRILARNLRWRLGEIDLLCEAPDGRTVVVVEVKAALRRANAPPPLRPEVHVNAAKQRKLTALAGQLGRRRELADRPIRFDVVAVELVERGEPVLRHHVGAFQARF